MKDDLMEVEAIKYLYHNEKNKAVELSLILILSGIENIYNIIFKYENNKNFKDSKKEILTNLGDFKKIFEDLFLENGSLGFEKSEYFKKQISEHFEFIFKYLDKYDHDKLSREQFFYIDIEEMSSEVLILKKEVSDILR